MLNLLGIQLLVKKNVDSPKKNSSSLKKKKKLSVNSSTKYVFFKMGKTRNYIELFIFFAPKLWNKLSLYAKTDIFASCF